MKKRCLLLEVGVLLDKNNEEFESYNMVYDKKYGYYDENQIYYNSEQMQEAIDYAKKYVENGVENTYAILSESTYFDEDYEKYGQDLELSEEQYDLPSIIFSYAKINNACRQFIF